MESVLDKMTDDQKKLLKQFREDLNVELNPSHTDELLVKFLRARSFNLEAAKKIFLEIYYTRMLFDLDTILDTYKKPEVLEKYETASVLGFAKDGTLIRYIAAGRLDAYGFIMSMSCSELCMYFVHQMELDKKALMEESLRTGKNLSEITFIFDLEEFTLQQVLHKNVIEVGLDVTRLLQDCYPEIWRNVLVVNVPKIFNTAFGIFKTVIRSTIVEKIRMADKGHTKDLLLQYIDEDVLPSFLGGKRVDSKGDPMCKEFINFGGKVSEAFYSKNCRIQLSLDDPEVQLINIGRRSVFNLCIAVKEPNSTLEILGRSENGSLSTFYLYKEFDPDPDNTEMPGCFEYFDENSENFRYKQISVETRAQIHCTQEEKKVLLPWPGIYVLRVSNASNWFSSRKLYIKYKVIPPNPKNL